jgi:hypothetical protein
VLLGIGAAAVLILGWVLLANRQALEVTAATVYPGQRRAVGSALGVGQLLGAPQLASLQTNPPIVASNQSELSSAYLIALIAAGAMAVQVRWEAVPQFRRLALAAGSVSLAVLSWTAIEWPQVAEALIPLSLIPVSRAAQVQGLAAVITFAFVYSAWLVAPTRSPRVAAASLAIPAFFLTAAAGSALQSYQLPALATRWLWASAVLTAVVIAYAAHARSRIPALAPAVGAAFCVVFAVNPVQIGSGDLTGGAAAAEVRRLASEGGAESYGASDDLGLDAVLMANGVRSLSGQQMMGPNAAAWHVLDPGDAFVDVWNRGASYIRFEWVPGGATTISNKASLDIIDVTIDPCSPALKTLGLTWVLSSQPIAAACLEPGESFDFGGSARQAYRIPANQGQVKPQDATPSAG